MKNVVIAGVLLMAGLVTFIPAHADDKGGKGKLKARVAQLEKETASLQEQLLQFPPVINRMEMEVKQLQAKVLEIDRIDVEIKGLKSAFK